MNKRIMYHITNRKNIDSILRLGLIPKKPDYGHGKELDWKFVKGVYLTIKKSNYNSKLIVTLKVKVHNLDLKKDKDPEIKDSFYTEKIIKPSRIILPVNYTKDKQEGRKKNV